jgi:cytochrome d ubiquinol oxidase subunit I
MDGFRQTCRISKRAPYGSAAVLQAVSGDALARMTARNVPTKLAAMEGDFQTRSGAPLRIGGLPDVRTRQTNYAIEIPDGLSLLAFHSPHATVQGLDKTPQDEWPKCWWYTLQWR